MNNGIEGMNDRLNGSTPSLSDIKKEVTTHTVPSSIERLNGRTPSLSNLTTETPNGTVTPSIDRLNGGTQSLSDIQLEVTPKTITPSKIISAIENAGIRYEGDRIIIRGGNITIGSVTYKKLTGAGEKGPVYQVGTSVGGKDYIRLRDREKSEMGIEYGKYDSGGKYILCGKLENGAILKGEAYRIDLTNGDLYSGTFDNNSNMVGTVQYGVIRGGTIKEGGVDQYDGHIKNGKKEGSGKYISANGGWTFDGTRENDKMKSGKLEMANGDKYEGDLVTINEHSLWTRDIVKKILEGNLEDDEIIQLHERLQMDNGEIGGTAYYKEANSKYECTITSGKITELSDNADFITMFGDNKEDEHWDAKRGDIVFEAGINNNSYILHSWNQKTERKLSGGYYDFGDGLKISKDNPHGIKLAKHIANLINFFKDYKSIMTKNYRNDAFYFSDDGALTSVYQDTSLTGCTYCLRKRNNLLSDVSTHFGGVNAEKLAIWLNKTILGVVVKPNNSGVNTIIKKL